MFGRVLTPISMLVNVTSSFLKQINTDTDASLLYSMNNINIAQNCSDPIPIPGPISYPAELIAQGLDPLGPHVL